ncbi:MAG: tRNA pseudouridine(38-40) synthase TruA [Candidatus Omnitrophica bacterium]|nr:tRNA pseudouridine(38-40) synthase TruA [Candidatus Omnitrophota bacterium]
MRNIKLTIEYEGTDYSGWQVQEIAKKKQVKRQSARAPKCRKRTIQGTIEKALQRLLQEKVRVIGSGRTDAGVHARGQAANFKTRSGLDCRNIQKGLNSILPADIRIRQAEDAQPDFHARFSAQSKLYRYAIINHSFVPPHLRRFCHLVKCPLDVEKMRRAARCLLGEHNFRSFQAVDKKERRSVRKILGLDIRRDKNLIHLDIKADGFLYRMVRNIIGSLIEVGRGKLKPQRIREILRAKDRSCAGPCAPAKGLCLMEVKYKRG